MGNDTLICSVDSSSEEDIQGYEHKDEGYDQLALMQTDSPTMYGYAYLSVLKKSVWQVAQNPNKEMNR